MVINALHYENPLHYENTTHYENATQHNVRSVNAVSLSQMLRPQTGGGKVSLYANDTSVYHNYKHISVTPISSHKSTYSALRLHMLDILINRLVEEKKVFPGEENIDVASMSTESIDRLTAHYARQYQDENTLEPLVEDQGLNFGLHNSKTALFLDFLI
ncbi:MAG: hypothetical protein ACR2PY_00385 [Salinispira sp.]